MAKLFPRLFQVERKISAVQLPLICCAGCAGWYHNPHNAVHSYLKGFSLLPPYNPFNMMVVVDAQHIHFENTFFLFAP